MECVGYLMSTITGKMSDTRAIRKCQQLNNLVAMVTQLVHPGDTVVDFCSGGVRIQSHRFLQKSQEIKCLMSALIFIPNDDNLNPIKNTLAGAVVV